MEQFDLFVIGGGPGGYEAALEAAGMGKRVAVAEEAHLGGVCLNRGCIPTKTLLRSAHLYQEVVEGDRLGITAEGLAADFDAMHRNAEQVKETLRDGINALFQSKKVTLLPHRAEVAAPGIVRVDGTDYAAEHILLATGSRPARIPIPGIDLPGVVNSDDLLTGGGVDAQELIIIGGGVIGVEFAELYSALGRKVTILESLPRILEKLDREISQNTSMLLKKRGVAVHANATVQEITREGETLICHFSEKGVEKTVTGDCVLVCTGRKPNTEGLLSPSVGVELVRGFVPVNEVGETALSGLWAAGDIVLGGIQLAHMATAQGKRAVHAMFQEDVTSLEPIPSCVFFRPEIATVGLTADQAKREGIPVRVRKTITSANGRSLVEGSDRGFAKLVFHEETGVLLGAHLMCVHASEMIGGLAVAIRSGLTEAQMAGTVYPHPTVSEILAF